MDMGVTASKNGSAIVIILRTRGRWKTAKMTTMNSAVASGR